jgi:uncharacterized RDD family membrane protein YckC
MASANNAPEDHNKEGATDRLPKEIILAKWRTRFGAWLIDVIIVWIGIGILFQLISLPFWLFDNSDDTQSFQLGDETTTNDTESFDLGNGGELTWKVDAIGIIVFYFMPSFIFLAYWTYFESTTGQSIGKKLLKIKTTDLSGKKADTKSVVMECIGKSFLLLIDVFFGWLFSNFLRQRVFNKLSDTIVIKVSSEERIVTKVMKVSSEDGGRSDTVEYTKD